MIIYGLDNVKNLPESAVHLTIGTFDGVHLGHQKIIKSAIKGAKQANGISVVLTFWPHPSHFFNPNAPVPTIMSGEIKNHFLEEQGVDIVVQETFTNEFAHLSPEEFVQLLMKVFPQLKTIYAGNDFHFGYQRKGDIHFLERIGEYLGFNVIKQKSILYKGQRISSTRIRAALQEGNIEDANIMLGYPYFSMGLVVTPSFPLSIVWRPELKPKFGIYAIKIQNKNKQKKYDGIGYYRSKSRFPDNKQIIDNEDPRLEIYLCEPSELGPADVLIVEWFKYLGAEPKYDSEEAFQELVAQNIAEVKKCFLI